MLLLLSLLLFAPNVQGFLQDTICNVFPNFPIVCQNQNDKSSSAIYCNANPTNATKSQYDIQFAFRNVPLSSDQTLFTKAEKRWQQVLKGDVPDVILDVPIRTSCGDSPLTIDDIFICAHYDDIDGPEGILGSAGVIASRSTTDGPFPAIGEMRFDSDDVGFLGFANVIVSMKLVVLVVESEGICLVCCTHRPIFHISIVCTMQVHEIGHIVSRTLLHLQSMYWRSTLESYLIRIVALFLHGYFHGYSTAWNREHVG